MSHASRPVAAAAARGHLRTIALRAALVVGCLACSPAPAAGQTLAGSLPVSQSVSPSGSLSAQIPIPALPGAGNLEPKLFLSYSSQAGNTGAGLGWSVQGYLTVARGNYGWSVDGSLSPMDYAATDAFYLNGDRLVPVRETRFQGAEAIEYRKEIDDATVVYGFTSSTGNISSFLVETKSGLYTKLDVPVQGSHAAPSAFLPSKTYDTAGNYISWEFTRNGLAHELKRVAYTGHDGSSAIAPFAEIVFSYEAIATPIVSYVLGDRLARDHRLSHVTSNLVGVSTPGLDLALTYRDAANGDRFYLDKVQLTAFGRPVPGVTFTPTSAGTDWTEVPNLELPVPIAGEIPTDQAYRFGTRHDNAPATDSAMLMFSAESKGELVSRTYLSRPSGWTEVPARASPVPFVDGLGRSTGVVLVDVDGDGSTDLVQGPPAGPGRAWRQTSGGWEELSTHAPPVSFVDPTGASLEARPLLLDGDQRLDLLLRSPAGTYTALLNQAQGWTRSTVHEFTTAHEVHFADFDCDGISDRAEAYLEGNDLVIDVYSGSASGWTRRTEPGWAWRKPAQPATETATAKFAAAQCGGILVSGAGGLRALLGTPTGWNEVPAIAPSDPFADASGQQLHPGFADLDGDGADDVLIARTGSSRFTWMQAPRPQATDPVRWVAAPSNLSSPAWLAGSSRYPDVQLRDMNYDGKTDLVALPSARDPAGHVYLVNASGWQPALGFAPAVQLAQTKDNAGFLRFVDWNADGLVDIVFHDGGTQVGALQNTGAGWQAKAAWAPPRSLQRTNDVAAPGLFVDVNTDGYPDLVYSYSTTGGSPIRETYINPTASGGDGWGSPVTAWAPPIDFAAEKGGDLGVRVGDLNGDGRVDILAGTMAPNNYIVARTFLNTGQGWSESTDFLATVAFVQERSAGARRVDLGTQLMDVNGDRLPDLVAAYKNPNTGTQTKGVFLNDGSAFKNSPDGTVPVMLDSPYTDGSTNAFMDIDGDGNPEIVRFSNSGGEVFLGTGREWTTAASNWALPSETRSSAHGYAATRFVDLNGDGLLDIIYHWPGSGDHKGNFLNTGSGWRRGPAGLDPAEPLIEENGTDRGIRPIDVNGDGALDLVWAAKSAAGTLENGTWLSPGRRSGMVAAIVDSSGIATSYSYAPLTEPRAAGPRLFVKAAPSAYPAIPLTPFSPVVQKFTVDEGAGRVRQTRYSYAGFRLDIREARPLGFERVEITDELNGRIQRTEYGQAAGLVGHAVREEIAVLDHDDHDTEKVVSATAKGWTVSTVTSSDQVHGRAYSYLQVKLDNSTTREADLTGALLSEATTSIVYDPWLNAIQTTSSRTGDATKVEDNVFGKTGDYARFGRLTDAAVTVSKTGSPTVKRSTTFTYYPNLLLESEALDVGDPALGYSKTYARDARGNITSIQHAGAGAPTRSTSYEYDQLGRAIRFETNALNQRQERVYSGNVIAAALGMPVQVTDPNGRQKKITYDALGRLASTSGPDPVLRETIRLHPSGLHPDWLVDLDHHMATRAKTCHGKPLPPYDWKAPELGFSESSEIVAAGGARRVESVAIRDRAGRTIRTAAPRFDGQRVRWAYVDVDYDPRGRVIGESAPYFAGESSRWARYVYDSLDRRVMEVRVDGACNSVKFDGLKQERTDALGRLTVVTLNSDQQPVRVARPGSNASVFEYDAMGRLTSLTKPGGSVSTYTYDAAGNRDSVNEPDGGKVEYRFDGFGQMRGEKAAAQPQWAEIDYDPLGRIKRVWRPDQETNWNYDEPNSIGLLSRVTTQTQNVAAPVSYSERYEHDGSGRLRRTTVALTDPTNGTQFQGSYSFAYDPFSSLERILYPKSGLQPDFWVRREYQAETGQLLKVFDEGRPSQPLWQLSAADAKGRSLEVALGNGARETREFSTNTGRLWSLLIRANNGKKLWDGEYGYDLVGNLKSRGESVSKDVETFGYDILDRLTRASTNNDVVKAKFDDAGRMVSKSDVGKYEYGCRPEDGPHAVCRVTRNGVTTRELVYDAMGNATSTGDASVEYTFDHHVARITKVDANGNPTQDYATYVYGPAGQRVLTRERGCTDVVCLVHRVKETMHFGLYERVKVTRSGSTLVTDRYYVAGGDGIVATVDAIDRRFATGADAAGPNSATVYRHQDQLGSVVLLTNSTGKVLSRPRYDPWGQIRSGLKPGSDTAFGLEAALTRGFTGQDHVPQFDLVHMTGRLYDPTLGVFLSVDPLQTDPYLTGDLNPYLYSRGNPLFTADPSGFGLWEDFTGAVSDVGHAIGGAASDIWNAAGDVVHDTGEWIGKNWRELATTAVIIAVTYLATPAAGAVVAAMLAGAAGGAAYTALYGGTLQEVVQAAIVGGVTGALTAGIANAGYNPWVAAGLQGIVSGVQSGARGGSFEKGFAIGFISHGVRADRLVEGSSGLQVAGRIAVRAAANGTISEMQGDKFANGAISGAFEQLYADANRGQWRIRSVIQVVGAYRAREATLIGLGAGLVAWGINVADAPVFREGAIYFPVNDNSKYSWGITLGGAVLLSDDMGTAAHELRHVVQYGSWGSREFFRQYSDQLMRFGYQDASFEADARYSDKR